MIVLKNLIFFNTFRVLILLSPFLFHIAGFGQDSWNKSFPGVGSFSSPRVADLNGDGVGDIVLGIGREEFHSCDSAVIALDGKNGKILWKVKAMDQIFGSAIFYDIDEDGVQDVVIGGRMAELMAISGKKGKIIWRFMPFNRNIDDLRKDGWFNFYNPQWIKDQDNDHIPDLLVSNGGDVMKEAYDPNRPPGYLVVISGKTGKLIKRAKVPDGRETYMSVTVCPSPDKSNDEIIFGTGGETIGGKLYMGHLSDLMKGDLSASLVLDSSKDRGYIGPPARADVTGDGISDLIVNTVNGRMLAFDGSTYKKLWEIIRPSTETYSSIAVGNFNGDNIPDFFASYAMGSWPKLEWSTQFMADGKTGNIEFIDSLGFYQNASAVAVDWDGDGKDEVIMNINYQEVRDFFQKYFYTMLMVFDFQANTVTKISDSFPGSNLSSTPWIGDLDHDGFLDIIFCHGNNLRHTYTFDGLDIHRIATKVPVKGKIKWGSYQGSDYDGIYK